MKFGVKGLGFRDKVQGLGCPSPKVVDLPPPRFDARTGLSSLQYFGAKWDLQEYYDEVGQGCMCKPASMHGHSRVGRRPG